MGRNLSMALAGLVVMLFTACGPLPRPFMKDTIASRDDLRHHNLPPVIAVHTLGGVSIPMAKLLANSVVEELSRLEVIAYARDKETSTHVLNGWVDGPPNRSAKSVPNHIIWALTKKSGELVSTFKYKFKTSLIDWEYGAPDLIRQIGKGTAIKLAARLLGKPDIAEQRIVVKAGVWVRPISGVPGDGDFSLTRAIRYALGDAGMEVVKTQQEARFEIKAEVKIDPPNAGRQRVRIDWIVVDDQGGEIGRAGQKNTVPAGTFNFRWGQASVMIAEAAAGGIRDIVEKARIGRFKQNEPGQSPRLKQRDTNKQLILPPPTLTPN